MTGRTHHQSTNIPQRTTIALNVSKYSQVLVSADPDPDQKDTINERTTRALPLTVRCRGLILIDFNHNVCWWQGD